MQVVRFLSLLARVTETIEKYQMISQGDRVLVGVSGGPDSVALLHLLKRLEKKLGLSLFVAHLDHMFRGKESRDEADFVTTLCSAWQIPLFRKEIDVPKYLAKNHVSAQQGARDVRYRFYYEIVKRIGADRIALGHHADDQAETVLLNLIRGTGLKGLRGIPPVRDNIIRPLLEIHKSEILNYCNQRVLPFCEDSSNLKTVYLRNKIRLELMPLLKEQYNTKIVDSLINLSEIVRDEELYLDFLVNGILDSIILSRAENNIVLDLEKLLVQPPALKRRIIITVYSFLTREEASLSYEHVNKVLELAANQDESVKMQLPGGYFLVKRHGVLEMTSDKCYAPISFYRQELKVPGITKIPTINRSICTEVLTGEQVEDPQNYSYNQALLDYEKLQGPLFVRKRMDGDVFRPLGMKGRVKLKKFFIDLKVPQEKRDYVPIVVCGESIVWVGGYRLAEQYKISKETKKYLRINLI